MSSTTTTRLGLVKPTPGTSEPVNVATQINAAYDKIDSEIGAKQCTSSTRPASPYAGQVIRESDTGNMYVRNNANTTWDQIMLGVFNTAWDTRYTASTANTVSISNFTSSGTWNKPAGLKYIRVRAVGGGGGGGGATGAGSGQVEGGGGGGGGYCESIISAGSLGSSVTVTIGGGGNGGTNGSTNGSSGGNTTFGAFCTANGGSGGTAAGTATTGNRYADGGAGGSGSSGNVVNISGSKGSGGMVLTGASVVTGRGGASMLGSETAAQASASINGNNGQSYGGGGSGAYATTTTRVGGAGADGIVIVEQYF